LAGGLAFEDRDTGAVDLLCAINVFYCNGAVDNEVGLDDCLEVLGARVPDLGLEILSCLSLLELSFTEPLGFRFDSRHHSELTIVGVVIVQAIGVHAEVYVDAVWLVDLEGAFAVAVIGDMKFSRTFLRERMLVMALESNQTSPQLVT
jgi:hypothetical protein